MKPHWILAAIASLLAPGLMTGCGSSASMPNAEARAEPLSDSDLAAAQAEMDRAGNEERANQSVDPSFARPKPR